MTTIVRVNAADAVKQRAEQQRNDSAKVDLKKELHLRECAHFRVAAMSARPSGGECSLSLRTRDSGGEVLLGAPRHPLDLTPRVFQAVYNGEAGRSSAPLLQRLVYLSIYTSTILQEHLYPLTVVGQLTV